MDDTQMGKLIDTLIEVIKNTEGEEESEHIEILKSLIASGYFRTSRNPAPLNITEVGGYLNLLQEREEKKWEFVNSLLGLKQES